jgi:hypothetical protein
LIDRQRAYDNLRVMVMDSLAGGTHVTVMIVTFGDNTLYGFAALTAIFHGALNSLEPQI